MRVSPIVPARATDLVVQSGDRHSKLGPPKRISWQSIGGMIAIGVGCYKYLGNLLQQKGHLKEPVDICGDMGLYGVVTAASMEDRVMSWRKGARSGEDIQSINNINREPTVTEKEDVMYANLETFQKICSGGYAVSYKTMSSEAKSQLEPEGDAFQFSKDHYDQWKKSIGFTRIIARFLYGEDGSKVNEHSGMLGVALIGLMYAKETINTKKRDKEVEEIEKLLCFNEPQSQDISIMIKDWDENSTYTDIERIESSVITSADVKLSITDEDNNDSHTNSDTTSKNESQIIRENKRNDKNPKVRNDKKSKIETIRPIQAIKNHWRQNNGKDDLYVPLEFDGHGKEPTIFLIKFEKKMLRHFKNKVGQLGLIHSALKSCRGKNQVSGGLVWDRDRHTLKLRPCGGGSDMRYFAEYKGKETVNGVTCCFFEFNTTGRKH